MSDLPRCVENSTMICHWLQVAHSLFSEIDRYVKNHTHKNPVKYCSTRSTGVLWKCHSEGDSEKIKCDYTGVSFITEEEERVLSKETSTESHPPCTHMHVHTHTSVMKYWSNHTYAHLFFLKMVSQSNTQSFAFCFIGHTHLSIISLYIWP